MKVLVDSSVWIDYFRGGEKSELLDRMIDDNLICINDIILAELLPVLMVRKEDELISLLKKVERKSLNIDWSELVALQVSCLKSGINRVGIPDLIIAQNAEQNNLALFSLDKHFVKIAAIVNLSVV